MEPHATRRPGEVVFAALMLVLSLFLFWQAVKISGFSSKSSPGAFPMAATAVMVLASLFTVAKTLRLPSGETGLVAFRMQIMPNLFLLFGGLIVLYGAIMQSLGFVLASLVFLFGGIWLLYRRGPVIAFGYALLSIIIVYVIFRLVFKVVLPEGIIPERRILADVGQFISKVIGR